VERTAPSPVLPTTTASMDAGTNNTSLTFYEKGFNSDAPTTGLPPAGASLLSELGNREFLFPPSYKSNNAVLIYSDLMNATLTLALPMACSSLSFLVSGGNGGGSIGYTVLHQSGTNESGTLNCPNWLIGSSPAWALNGCLNISNLFFYSVNGTYPALYQKDIALVNSNSPITQVAFRYLAGAAHNAIFAVSGVTNGASSYSPLVVSGFNQDIVVEANSIHPTNLTGVTTATMDLGSANAQTTWYERGYYPVAPATGLPQAGSFLTNANDSSHWYVMPANYSNNNAVLLDAEFGSATLSPVSPAAWSVLSFLGASAHGAVTNRCVLYHTDGTSETNSFIMPDWLDTMTQPAFTANGRINTNRRMVDNLNTGSPRLFGMDVIVTRTNSAVTNMVLTFLNGTSSSAHEVIFAVSGSTSSSIARPTLTISPGSGGSLVLRSSGTGQLQSTFALSGAGTVWQSEGAISGTRTITPAAGEPRKFYRVLAQ